jgi:hypothetical protein
MLKIVPGQISQVVPTVATLESVAPFRNSKLQPAQQYNPLLKFKIDNFDNDTILQSVNEAMEMYGQWNYRIGEDSNGVKVDHGYGGIGLTYNPQYIDYDTTDVHQQVQGTPRPGAKGTNKNPFSVLDKTESRVFSKMNTHYDTYGFATRTPASKHGALGTFLDTISRTMVRSAVRIIYADQEGQVGEERMAGVRWHKDEPFFENLRINIPLLTDPIFLLEQEGYPPHHLESGYAYSWDTNTMHRAYATSKEPKHRIHLMLGFSCWWDFNEATGEWSQNKFFNKKHPLDMLVDGDVIPGLQLT